MQHVSCDSFAYWADGTCHPVHAHFRVLVVANWTLFGLSVPWLGCCTEAPPSQRSRNIFVYTFVVTLACGLTTLTLNGPMSDASFGVLAGLLGLAGLLLLAGAVRALARHLETGQ
jgi:hypothetical protein